MPALLSGLLGLNNAVSAAAPQTPGFDWAKLAEMMGAMGPYLMAAGSPSLDPGASGRILAQGAGQIPQSMRDRQRDALEASRYEDKQRERQAEAEVKRQALQMMMGGASGGARSGPATPGGAPMRGGLHQMSPEAFLGAPGGASGGLLSQGPGASQQFLRGLMMLDPAAGAKAGIEMNKPPALPTGMYRGQEGPEYHPSYLAGQEKLRAAGKTSVTTNLLPGEKEYSKVRGGSFAKRANDLDADAAKANRDLATIDTLDTLLADPNVYTGTGGEAISGLKKIGKTMFGMDIAGVGSAETARTLGREMALDMKSRLPGPMSDSDRKFLTDLPANLSNSREGNQLISAFYRRAAQRRIEVQKFANKYERENGRLDPNFEAKLAGWWKQNPIFTGTDLELVRELASTAVQPSPAAGFDPETRALIDKYR